MSQLKVNSIIPTGGLSSGASGGIIQVKQTVKTNTFSEVVANGNSSSVCISLDFAASSSSNKLLIIASLYCDTSDQPTNNGIQLTDDGSIITGARGDASGSQGRVSGAWGQVDTNEFVFHAYCEFLHTVSNTSSHTYGVKMYQGSSHSNQTLFLNMGSTSNTTTRLRPMSTLTVMEVSV